MVMGDFNAVIDPKKDKSKKRSKGNKFPKSTIQHMESLFLTDVWREKNKEAKGFTYYSDRHDSYSRIDQIWASKNMLTLIKEINILPTILSDHSPVEMTLWQRRSGSRRWRTDNNILKDPNIVKMISDDLRRFFQTNNTPGVSEETIWDAGKAYLRGRIISYTAMIKKRRLQRMEEIMKE